MKKLIFAMLISSLFIAACNKEEITTSITGDEISVSETPSAILSYISENYPDAEITTVLKSSGGSQYSVILDTYEQITFDKHGNVLNHGEEGILCDSTSGHHGVGGHHGGGHHGINHGSGIPVDSLPGIIHEYVNDNFPGFVIHNAHYDTLCQFGVVINVMIDSARTEHHKLVFDASGLYLALGHRIDTLDLPSAILTSITANYIGYSPRYKAESLTLESGIIQYRIFLHKQKERLIVVMLEDGSVVCEQ